MQIFPTDLSKVIKEFVGDINGIDTKRKYNDRIIESLFNKVENLLIKTGLILELDSSEIIDCFAIISNMTILFKDYYETCHNFSFPLRGNHRVQNIIILSFIDMLKSLERVGNQRTTFFNVSNSSINVDIYHSNESKTMFQHSTLNLNH